MNLIKGIDRDKWSILPLKSVSVTQAFRYKNRWWKYTSTKKMIYTLELDRPTDLNPILSNDKEQRVAVLKD